MSSPFPLPILFTAWVWKDGAGIAGEVIRRAKLGGFKTVAVQLSADTPADTIDSGSTLDRQDVDYLHQAGLFVVGWDPCGQGTSAQIADLPLDGWLPQIESATQRDALIAFLKAGVPALPRAVVTTYGGLDTTSDVAAFKQAWNTEPTAFVECYKADGYPHNDIDRMLAQGAVYGFDRSRLFAICGTYRGETPADYPGLDAADYGGIYLVENTSDDQLRAFAAFATAPAPDPTPAPTGGGTVENDAAARNDQVAKITQAWLDSFGPSPLSRMACEHDIAASSDDVWYSRRQFIRGSIDGTAQQEMARLQDELAKAQADLAGVTKQRDQLNTALAAANAKIAAAKAALA